MNLTYTMDVDAASNWTLVSTAAHTREQLPYVQELGDFIAHENYTTARDGLSSYLIKYTLSGEGRLDYNGQTAYVPAGHFFWIDCEEPQTYRTSERTGAWRVVWVHFYGAGCKYCYERFLAANGGKNTGELPQGNPVAQSVYRLISLYAGEEPKGGADIAAASLLYGIMDACIRGCTKSDTPAARYVRQAQDFMAAHYKERVTLDTLAKALSLNKFYLQKVFARETGHSPATHLQQLRISRAKELLRAGDMPSAAVAHAVGLENESYFIRLFREAEGLTPAAYRRQWR